MGDVHLVELVRLYPSELVHGNPQILLGVQAVVPSRPFLVDVVVRDDADVPTEVRFHHGVQPRYRTENLVEYVAGVLIEHQHVELHQHHAEDN